MQIKDGRKLSLQQKELAKRIGKKNWQKELVRKQAVDFVLNQGMT